MLSEVRLHDNRRVFIDLSEHDRVRGHTPDRINRLNETKIHDSIEHFSRASEPELSRRIDQLEQEWDVDRALLLTFSILGGAALLLGRTRNRKWLNLLSIQIPFLGYHAIAGWCPPVSVLRRLGYRTSREIDAEKYALKTLRGDFRKD